MSSANKKIFILVPAPTPDGPIKGAFALANMLARKREVTLVTLKSGAGVNSPLDDRVQHISLAVIQGRWAQIRAYRQLLKAHGTRTTCSSLSMCFSADVVNLFCRRQAVTSTSIRGNLMKNYTLDYGWRGILLGTLHLFITRGFDHCIAMTSAMAGQVRRHGARHPKVVGNFVDEEHLERFRRSGNPSSTEPLRFVFVASMSSRKQPLTLISAFADLLKSGVQGRLDMIGNGPLLVVATESAAALGIASQVHFHGHLETPHDLIAKADAMILPSLSEGMPRAAMEALHLGVPCVLRNVDANADLISPRVNGLLFDVDSELCEAMHEAAIMGRAQRPGPRPSLLPSTYRQGDCAARYLSILETTHG
jgi:glycosyltransferase involved in cell wall biosynthesis